MERRRDSDYPSLPELRRALTPGADEDRWDAGELPRAICHLDSQAVLGECRLLLRLACVVNRSLDETAESRAVALREILVDLLPKDLDDPSCQVLRILAGLEPGTAGRGREQRQEAAGWRLGSDSQPATSRTVRRVAKQRCWPWLLDRLIEREVQERRQASRPDTGLTVAPPRMPWGPGDAWGEGLPYHVTPGSSQPAEEWGRSEDAMKRRTFVLGVPAAFLSLRTGRWQPLLGRIEAATLDAAALDELAAAVARDGRLHDRLGSRAVQGLVTERVRLATELLKGSPPASLRARLAEIASDAAWEAGLAFHDQGQFLASESYHRLAAELAQEADDPLRAAYALGAWGWKLTAASNGAGGIGFLERAKSLAAGADCPVTDAYLAAAEAEAQATLGNAAATMRALDRVDRSLERKGGAQDPPWLYWFDSGQAAGWKGQSSLRLGRLDDAEALLGAALSSWDPSFVRDRAITLVDLASVRLGQGELDECCRLAAEALDVAVSTTSPRLVQRVRTLRSALPSGGTAAGVRALDDRLATAVWV